MKRIISLILVLATALFALTGCAYNYEKSNMKKYVDFDKDAFYAALHNLLVNDATFSPDSDRDAYVTDALAKELISVATDKKVFGQLKAEDVIGMYDALTFCYYATDADGNIFYASKLDQTKPETLQVGLSTLAGAYEKIAEKLLTLTDLTPYFYYNSNTQTVEAGDIVSVSYIATWTDPAAEAGSNTEKLDDVRHEYVVVKSDDEFSKNFIGLKVGEEKAFTAKDTVKVNDADVEVTKSYSGAKVEHIVEKANATTVANGDKVNVSYTLKFKSEPFYVDGVLTLPETFNGKAYAYTTEGEYVKITVAYDTVTVEADAPEIADDAKTFLGQLVGKKPGDKTNLITEKGVSFGGKTVDFEYYNVTVNWIEGTQNAIEVPYEVEALNEEKTNKKTEKNIYGKEIELNGKTLTYHILPLYYVDIADAFSETRDTEAAAKFILSNLAGTVYSYKTLTDAAISALVNGTDDNKQLVQLFNEKTTAKTATANALKNLKDAQDKYVDATPETEATLKTARTTAENDYRIAYFAEQTVTLQVEAKVDEILAAKASDANFAVSLINDYFNAKYSTLNETYLKTIKDNLSTEIGKIVSSSITFNGKLPKKAVREAYNIIMDAYKQNFYEGKYSGNTDSAASQTNYYHYNGNFNRYFIETVLQGEEGGMKEAKAKIKAQAEEAVKEIIVVYALTELVEEAWDTSLLLTEAQKEQALLDYYNSYEAYMYYAQYGLILADEDIYRAAQLENVFNFLLYTEDIYDENGVRIVYYTNIAYNTK